MIGDWWKTNAFVGGGRSGTQATVRALPGSDPGDPGEPAFTALLGIEICNSFLGIENSGCEPNHSTDRTVA